MALLTILFSVIGLALGQGGTGRENTNATKAATKKTNPPKRTTPRGSTRPSSDNVNTEATSSLSARHPGKNRAGIEFVLISPGSFMMGSTDEEARAAFERLRNIYSGTSADYFEKYSTLRQFDNEKPKHQVTINYSFYMGKYEVTQAQWRAVMGNNPSTGRNCGDRCPVESVSWDDALRFIQKLNQANNGYTYRLPTESEWEYACRAGTTGEYAGNLKEMAWFTESNDDDHRVPDISLGIQVVGQKQPNAWGLYDMHGNVWEWCEDLGHKNYSGAPTDGSAWLVDGEKSRVVRGGSFFSGAKNLRSAARRLWSPDAGYFEHGFRVVAVARTK